MENTKNKMFLIIDEVNCCENCMFCQYDDYVTYKESGGYNCIVLDKRIVDIDTLVDIINKQKEYNDEQLTLFSKPKPPQNPLKTRPDWCPLKTLNELKEIINENN